MRGAILALAAVVLLQQPPLRVSARARAVRPGEVVVLEIAGGDSAAAVHVRAFDRDVPVYTLADGGRRALVGIDLDVRPGTYAASIDAGGAHAAYDLVVARRAFRTRTLTVDPAFVTPPESARERIDREAKLLDQIWRASSSDRQWSAPFVRPVAEPANSAFGTRSVFNGQPRSAHGGADFLSPAGTPIHAPNAGRIVLARDLYFSGNTVVIDHGLGLFSMLAHLSAIDVHEGDAVEADQRIGLVGATGRVTGPHLHWAVRAGGARVDPLSLLAVLGGEP
jgi:murein DD-endopeptidase MepM/ murein hydrolase activator NlpD